MLLGIAEHTKTCSKDFEITTIIVIQKNKQVDLSTHTGFMGGLESNLSTGVSAPYFATHAMEVLFHVSTRMPGSEEESLKTKVCEGFLNE